MNVSKVNHVDEGSFPDGGCGSTKQRPLFARSGTGGQQSDETYRTLRQRLFKRRAIPTSPVPIRSIDVGSGITAVPALIDTLSTPASKAPSSARPVIRNVTVPAFARKS